MLRALWLAAAAAAAVILRLSRVRNVGFLCLDEVAHFAAVSQQQQQQQQWRQQLRWQQQGGQQTGSSFIENRNKTPD